LLAFTYKIILEYQRLARAFKTYKKYLSKLTKSFFFLTVDIVREGLRRVVTQRGCMHYYTVDRTATHTRQGN